MIHSRRHHPRQPLSSKLQRSFSQVRPQNKKPSTASRNIASFGQSSKPTTAAASSSSQHDSSPSSNELTLIVMGGEKVGKSALVSQFLWDTFLEEYHPTVEEFNWIEYDIGGNELMLQVIDTAGSHDFLAMRKIYAHSGDGYFVVFAVDDPASFLEAQRIVDEILEENHRNAPIVLVANKFDKVPDDWDQSILDDYATSKNLKYVAISAKQTDRVHELFSTFLNKLKGSRYPSSVESQLRKRRQSMPTRRGCSGNIDIDVAELERIAKRHSRRDNCVIS